MCRHLFNKLIMHKKISSLMIESAKTKTVMETKASEGLSIQVGCKIFEMCTWQTPADMVQSVITFTALINYNQRRTLIIMIMMIIIIIDVMIWLR